MGCWNKTCGLSNLHIIVGTPVYVFVLEDKRDDSNCYTTSLFRPLLLPFESTYDDYGGGEHSHGLALPLIMNGIKEDLVEMEVGKNEYHDIAVKKDGFDAEKFFEACHENRLQIQGRFRAEPTNLQFTMFRKDVVDNILEQRVIEEYVGGGNGTHGWGNNYVSYHFKDIVASVRPLLERLVEDINKSDNEFIRFAIFDRMHKYRDEFKAAQWLHGDNYRYSRIVDVRFIASDLLNDASLESLDRLELLLIEHLKAIFIDGFMMAARKTWIPGGHEGSQSQSGGALRLLAGVTLGILDKEKAEYFAENDVSEDEYTEE